MIDSAGRPRDRSGRTRPGPSVPAVPSPVPVSCPGDRFPAPGLPGAPAAPDLAVRPDCPDPTAELGRLITGAVALLPGLPPADPLDRYGLRRLTALWLASDKTDHTRRAYYADLAAWLAWCTRTGLDPLRARRADVDAWKTGLTRQTPDGTVRPVAPSTLARRLAGISSWYRYLQSNEACERNPVAAVRRPRTAGTPPLPALEESSAVRLLDHCTRRASRNDTEVSWRDATVLTILFTTGLRVSALTGARVTDLTLDGGHTVLRYRKKGGQQDLVPLPDPVLPALRRYLHLRAAREGLPPTTLNGPLLVTVPRRARRPGAPPDADAHDVPGTGGRPLTQRDVWRTLRTLAAQAHLPEAATITPHTARRTAGTLLLARGVPVQKVQDLLGHADIRITRDRYDAHRHKLDSSPAHTLASLLTDRPPHDGTP
jgi:integrase/recombinase XerD